MKRHKTVRSKGPTILAIALALWQSLVSLLPCYAESMLTEAPAVMQSSAAASAHPEPINLDLTSTERTLDAPHFANSNPIEILVGETTRKIDSASLLTPSERLAAYQVFSTGNQDIVLGALGNAVAGTFNIGPKFSQYVSDLVIPAGVTAVQNAAIAQELNLSGNLTNSGAFYAVSTSHLVSSVNIGASNVVNSQGAILSSVLPSSGLPGISNVLTNLNLNLNAVNDIVNHGTISSSGNLTASAGGSIVNTLPASVTAPAPVMQALGNLNLSSEIGNIVNSGIIAAASGNVNVTSQIVHDIMLDNPGGRIEALQGAINLREANFTGASNLTVTGGDLLAKELNLRSGAGALNIDVKEITGDISLCAAEAHVVSQTGSLSFQKIDLSGDPYYFAAGGDLLIPDINAPNTAPGTPYGFYASGNVGKHPNASGILNIGAGNLEIVAGARYESSTGAIVDGSGRIDLPDATITCAKCTFVANGSPANSTPAIALGTITAKGDVTIVGSGDISLNGPVFTDGDLLVATANMKASGPIFSSKASDNGSQNYTLNKTDLTVSNYAGDRITIQDTVRANKAVFFAPNVLVNGELKTNEPVLSIAPGYYAYDRKTFNGVEYIWVPSYSSAGGFESRPDYFSWVSITPNPQNGPAHALVPTIQLGNAPAVPAIEPTTPIYSGDGQTVGNCELCPSGWAEYGPEIYHPPAPAPEPTVITQPPGYSTYPGYGYPVYGNYPGFGYPLPGAEPIEPALPNKVSIEVNSGFDLIITDASDSSTKITLADQVAYQLFPDLHHGEDLGNFFASSSLATIKDFKIGSGVSLSWATGASIALVEGNFSIHQDGLLSIEHPSVLSVGGTFNNAGTVNAISSNFAVVAGNIFNSGEITVQSATFIANKIDNTGTIRSIGYSGNAGTTAGSTPQGQVNNVTLIAQQINNSGIIAAQNVQIQNVLTSINTSGISEQFIQATSHVVLPSLESYVTAMAPLSVTTINGAISGNLTVTAANQVSLEGALSVAGAFSVNATESILGENTAITADEIEIGDVTSRGEAITFTATKGSIQTAILNSKAAVNEAGGSVTLTATKGGTTTGDITTGGGNLTVESKEGVFTGNLDVSSSVNENATITLRSKEGQIGTRNITTSKGNTLISGHSFNTEDNLSSHAGGFEIKVDSEVLFGKLNILNGGPGLKAQAGSRMEVGSLNAHHAPVHLEAKEFICFKDIITRPDPVTGTSKTGNGGNVLIVSGGFVQGDKIETGGANHDNYSTEKAGSVKILAGISHLAGGKASGYIAVSSGLTAINTSGSTAAGNITLAVENVTPDTQAISIGKIEASSNKGKSAFISIMAPGDISTHEIEAKGASVSDPELFPNGAININTFRPEISPDKSGQWTVLSGKTHPTLASITTGDVVANFRGPGSGSNGTVVNINASSDVTIGGKINTSREGGDGGAVTVVSGGTLKIQGNVTSLTFEGTGSIGGTIKLEAQKDLIVDGSIDSSGIRGINLASSAGSITAISATGSITIDKEVSASGSAVLSPKSVADNRPGSAAPILLSAKNGTVTVKELPLASKKELESGQYGPIAAKGGKGSNYLSEPGKNAVIEVISKDSGAVAPLLPENKMVDVAFTNGGLEVTEVAGAKIDLALDTSEWSKLHVVLNELKEQEQDQDITFTIRNININSGSSVVLDTFELFHGALGLPEVTIDGTFINNGLFHAQSSGPDDIPLTLTAAHFEFGPSSQTILAVDSTLVSPTTNSSGGTITGNSLTFSSPLSSASSTGSNTAGLQVSGDAILNVSSITFRSTGDVSVSAGDITGAVNVFTAGNTAVSSNGTLSINEIGALAVGADLSPTAARGEITLTAKGGALSISHDLATEKSVHLTGSEVKLEGTLLQGGVKLSSGANITVTSPGKDLTVSLANLSAMSAPNGKVEFQAQERLTVTASPLSTLEGHAVTFKSMERTIEVEAYTLSGTVNASAPQSIQISAHQRFTAGDIVSEKNSVTLSSGTIEVTGSVKAAENIRLLMATEGTGTVNGVGSLAAQNVLINNPLGAIYTAIGTISGSLTSTSQGKLNISTESGDLTTSTMVSEANHVSLVANDGRITVIGPVKALSGNVIISASKTLETSGYSSIEGQEIRIEAPVINHEGTITADNTKNKDVSSAVSIRSNATNHELTMTLGEAASISARSIKSTFAPKGIIQFNLDGEGSIKINSDLALTGKIDSDGGQINFHGGQAGAISVQVEELRGIIDAAGASVKLQTASGNLTAGKVSATNGSLELIARAGNLSVGELNMAGTEDAHLTLTSGNGTKNQIIVGKATFEEKKLPAIITITAPKVLLSSELKSTGDINVSSNSDDGRLSVDLGADETGLIAGSKLSFHGTDIRIIGGPKLGRLAGKQVVFNLGDERKTDSYNVSVNTKSITGEVVLSGLNKSGADVSIRTAEGKLTVSAGDDLRDATMSLIAAGGALELSTNLTASTVTLFSKNDLTARNISSSGAVQLVSDTGHLTVDDISTTGGDITILGTSGVYTGALTTAVSDVDGGNLLILNQSGKINVQRVSTASYANAGDVEIRNTGDGIVVRENVNASSSSSNGGLVYLFDQGGVYTYGNEIPQPTGTWVANTPDSTVLSKGSTSIHGGEIIITSAPSLAPAQSRTIDRGSTIASHSSTQPVVSSLIATPTAKSAPQLLDVGANASTLELYVTAIAPIASTMPSDIAALRAFDTAGPVIQHSKAADVSASDTRLVALQTPLKSTQADKLKDQVRQLIADLQNEDSRKSMDAHNELLKAGTSVHDKNKIVLPALERALSKIVDAEKNVRLKNRLENLVIEIRGEILRSLIMDLTAAVSAEIRGNLGASKTKVELIKQLEAESKKSGNHAEVIIKELTKAMDVAEQNRKAWNDTIPGLQKKFDTDKSAYETAVSQDFKGLVLKRYTTLYQEDMKAKPQTGKAAAYRKQEAETAAKLKQPPILENIFKAADTMNSSRLALVNASTGLVNTKLERDEIGRIIKELGISK